MPLQLGDLRDALLDAGARPDKADKAAAEVAGYETRVSKIEADLLVLKAMVGTNVALTLAVLIKLFT